jgi:hypothetical protein
VYEESLRYEDLDRYDQIFLLSLLLKCVPCTEYHYFLADADSEGELVDSLMPLLRNPNDPESLLSFKNKVFDILIKHYAFEFNKRIEANLRDRISNPQDYEEVEDGYIEDYSVSYQRSSL